MGPTMISYKIPVLWHGNQNQVSGIVWTLSAGLKKVGCSATHDGVHVITEMGDRRELKMRFHVSGARTQAIFDDAFTELVDAAQPIPGFRRTKGVIIYSHSADKMFCMMDELERSGKTPDIPKEILLHILGPSKVKKKSIRRIIDSTVAEYVDEEGLNVSKDLSVEESYEELEASFKPGNDFRFNAVIRLMEKDART